MNPNKLPAGFSDFWSKYPKKVGKGSAVRAFVSVGGKDSLPEIMKDLRRRQWPDDVQFIPHPATYLNQWRWLDEDSGQEGNSHGDW
mgnify:FL=1